VQDALREEVLDILRPDLALHGITQVRRLAALAETYYIAVAPHHDGGPIGTAAALHLAASLPNFFIQQIPVPKDEADRRMRAELTGGSIEVIKDGFAPLPAGPGLGITVHDEALEKYQERLI
jgi:galactonate dehydratase